MKKAILATAVAMAATGVMADDWKYRNDGFTNWNDIEINLDANRLKTRNTENSTPTDDSVRIGDDSRLLVAGQWRTSRENGNFVTAVGEALLKTDGTLAMDDAFFAFGNKDNWLVQIGRYEAMDLFPLGKDVAFSYAVGSDERQEMLNEDRLYVYRGGEARGRGDGYGQARLQAEMSGFTAEVSTLFGQTDFNSGDATVGNFSQTNSFMFRPAVNYTTDDGFLSVTVGGEWEARKSGISFTGADGKSITSADRYGVAATSTMQFGPLAWHLSGAYQDVDEFRKAYSIGSNVEFLEQWGAGFVYAQNDLMRRKGNVDYAKPKGYTIYGAYTMPVLGFDNAEVTLGLSYAKTENVEGVKGMTDDDLFFRTRFNYYF